MHNKSVLGPLNKVGMAPSVPSVNRYIRAREVTIAYGYDRDRLHVTLRSAETL